jgi:hypothetical protein
LGKKCVFFVEYTKESASDFGVLGWLVDYDTNALRKKVNEVQKEISAKKKVRFILLSLKKTGN